MRDNSRRAILYDHLVVFCLGDFDAYSIWILTVQSVFRKWSLLFLSCGQIAVAGHSEFLILTIFDYSVGMHDAAW